MALTWEDAHSDPSQIRRLIWAMNGTIGTYSSVDGVTVPLITTAGELEYGSYLATWRAPVEHREIVRLTVGDRSHGAIPFDDPYGGGFHVAFCSLGTNRGFAYHFLNRDVGVIFDLSGGASGMPEVVHVDQQAMAEILRQRFGVVFPFKMGPAGAC